MPPELTALYQAMIANPFVLGGGVLFGAGLAAFLAKAQLTHSGLEHLSLPGLERLDWPTLGAALAFWFASAIGLAILVPERLLEPVLLPIFGLLLKLAEAGLVLGVVAWALQALRIDEDRRDSQAQEHLARLRSVGVGLGGFVTVAVVTGSGWIPLLLVGTIVLGVVWLFRDAQARTGIWGWIQDIQAGLRLREHWSEGGQVAADGRVVLLTGPVGLGDTPILEKGEPSRLRNRDLAALVAQLESASSEY
jgi:hypothetical protein